MLASSKHKYSKTLAFPDTYYELIINVLQSVELFCAYIVKGIMTVKGALKAKEAGASAIIVSNHGGRVLDQCPATAEVLESIVKALEGSGIKILVDGGIRSGTDVFKALALGADGVLIARPFVTAVYGGKADGVRAYIDKIGTELEDTMKMCGVSSLDEITRDCVMTF